MTVNSVKELLFSILGGSALLMYGVDLMGDGLEKAAGSFIKKILYRATGSLMSSFLTGTGITALVQSSTAVTVLAVSFVNSGFMSFKQAVGIIYGANIGTTITAQLMAFDITGSALLALGIGYITMTISKKHIFKYMGQSIMGFGMLFLGLRLVNSGVPYLQKNPLVVHFLKVYSSSLIAALALGVLFTVLVQSSSAVMGITMILAGAGLITMDGAIGLMLGSNIGTCATAQLAAVNGNTASKRTAWAHTLYNIIGAAIVLISIKPFLWLVHNIMPGMPVERQIANAHTVFNILSALLFLPVTDYYVKAIEFLVPDRKR